MADRFERRGNTYDFTAIGTGPITSSHAWARRTRLYYLSVALALLAFNVAIIL